MQADVWWAMNESDRFDVTDKKKQAACSRQDLVAAQITRTRTILSSSSTSSNNNDDAAAAFGMDGDGGVRHHAALGHVSNHLWGLDQESDEHVYAHVRCARASRLAVTSTSTTLGVEGARCGHTPGSHEHVVCPLGHACVESNGYFTDALDLKRFYKPVGRHVCVAETRLSPPNFSNFTRSTAAATSHVRFPFQALKGGRGDVAEMAAEVCEGLVVLGKTIEIVPAQLGDSSGSSVDNELYHHGGQPRVAAKLLSKHQAKLGASLVSYSYTVSLCGPRHGGAVCWHEDMVGPSLLVNPVSLTNTIEKAQSVDVCGDQPLKPLTTS